MESQFRVVSVASARRPSTANTYDVGGEIEFHRWILATGIAVIILVLITGLAFLLESFWSWKPGRNDTKPLPHPGGDLLRGVTCNSTLCRRYAGLIMSCMARADKSPCDGLSDFVCGEGLCYGRPVQSLVRGFLRSMASEALATWRPRGNQNWTAVDRTAALYKECREGAEPAVEAQSKRDDVDVGELAAFLTTNETASELATRLAARYQDGAFFWLDVAPTRGGPKRRLQLRANTQYLQYAESRDSSSRRRRRRSALEVEVSEQSRTPDVGRNILSARDRVYTLWKKAGNLRAYAPQVLALRDLNRRVLSTAVLIETLNQAGASQFVETERIEVANDALLPFLAEVLRVENVKTYVAWEFLRHRRTCRARIGIEEKTLANSCFDCVERVAGLAAHAPFLTASHNAVHLAKISSFLQSVREFMITALTEATWLSSNQQERLATRVYGIEFMLGVPARHNDTWKLNSYYDYLPPNTGSFTRDYSEAVRAFWNWSLRRAADPFPLLSAVPNVLSTNNTVYIPAVALVPPLFGYEDLEPKNYGFLGVAVIRAVVHSLGLTGLQPLPDPYDVETLAHFDDLARCLLLNRSMPSYSSRIADVMAVGAALRALRKRDKGPRGDEGNRLLFNSCLLMCTAQDPHRCDEPARQTGLVEDLLECPRHSVMKTASQCAVW